MSCCGSDGFWRLLERGGKLLLPPMAEERSGFIFRVLISLARIMFVFCGKTQVNAQVLQRKYEA